MKLPNKACCNELKKSNVIEIDGYKFIIHKVSKEYVEVLPITHLDDPSCNSGLIPRMKVMKVNLSHYKKLDDIELLYLVNVRSPLVIEAIEYFLENEAKKSRQN